MKARMKHLLLPAAMALLALVACSDKDHDGTDTDDRTPISITAAVITGNSYSSSVYRGGGSRRLTEESSPATRATDNAWQATDAIGIILLQSGTATPVEGNPTAARYVTPTANGRFSPADEANTAYYPTQGEEADVLAFYPYRELGADLMIPVSTASQTALSQIDLMVADKSPSHSATKPDVSLAFSHKLVKLVITVDREAFAADVDLNGATVVLQGTATTARWSLTGEKLIKDEASKADISLPMTYDATASASGTAASQTLPGRLSGTAIVLPTAADAGVKLVITTAAGQAFDAPLSAGTALVPGTVNTLRVHLRQTGVAINATVTDWTTGVTADLKSLEMEVTATDGTEAGINALTLWPAATPTSKAEYTFDATTAKWSSPTPFYLENLAADATFFARTEMTATPDPVSGLSDVLGNITPATLHDGGIALKLEHLYARLNIALLKGETFPAGTNPGGATLTLDGLKKGTDISDENVVTARDADTNGDGITDANDATACTLDDAGNASFIIAPQEMAAGTRFTVKLKDTAASSNSTNADTYTAVLAEALTLKSGTIATLNLTLTPTKLGISATMTDWGTGITADQSIRIDGLTDGSGKDEIALAATQRDMLRLTYLADGAATGTASPSATYLYTAGAWTCDAPLYWDHLPQTGTPCNFAALFTPAATPAGDNERDYLSGTATTPFGTSPAFVLKHSLARIELQLTATGFTAAELAAARVSLDTVQPLATIAPDGVTTTDANTTRPRTLSVDKAGERFSLILAPQSFTTGSRLATIAVTGHTYGVSTPAGMKAEAGKTTVLKITLSKSAISGISVSTTDWTTGEEHTGDAGYDD